MRVKIAFLSLAFLLFIASTIASAQGASQVVAGPNGDHYRIVATFIPETPEDTSKMQSFILDTPFVKQGEQPAWFFLDMTTTSRNLDTDEKKQKLVLLRWGQTGDAEAQCTQGWTKITGGEVEKIVAAARSLYQISPATGRQTVQLQLPKDIEQKVSAVLNNLETSKMQCIQDGVADKQ
jgi:hypothetical protein